MNDKLEVPPPEINSAATSSIRSTVSCSVIYTESESVLLTVWAQL